MIDLSMYVYDEYKKGDDTELFLIVKKDMYDKLRDSDIGELYYNDRVFTIKNFATDCIGLGYDCDFHIFISVDETIRSIRNKKLKQLGI